MVDWQTKEWLESEFQDIKEQLDAIKRHLNIEDEEDFLDEETNEEEESKDFNVEL